MLRIFLIIDARLSDSIASNDVPRRRAYTLCHYVCGRFARNTHGYGIHGEAVAARALSWNLTTKIMTRDERRADGGNCSRYRLSSKGKGDGKKLIGRLRRSGRRQINTGNNQRERCNPVSLSRSGRSGLSFERPSADHHFPLSFAVPTQKRSNPTLRGLNYCCDSETSGTYLSTECTTVYAKSCWNKNLLQNVPSQRWVSFFSFTIITIMYKTSYKQPKSALL